jgi:serine/threonine-protein kinase/endoribonuclease IRE1
MSALVDKVKTIPDYAAARVVEFLTNPILFLIAMAAGIWYLNLRRADVVSAERSSVAALPAISEPAKLPSKDVSPVTEAELVPHEPAQVNIDVPRQETSEKDLFPEVSITQSVPFQNQDDTNSLEPKSQPNGVESPEKKKKKNHRGTRGGVKHKKTKKQDPSQSPEDKSTISEVDPIRDGIDKMLQPSEPRLKPNVKSVVGNPEDISAAGFEINGLQVNLDEQLGMGSNGTVVFPGTFHKREVAVKRMLAVFYDIASQETQLLLESDNHPNGECDEFVYLVYDLTFYLSDSVLRLPPRRYLPLHCLGALPRLLG